MADSGLIISFLTKELGLDPTEGLTPEQRGISRAITKVRALLSPFLIMLKMYRANASLALY
jgi:hypothetical protein